MIVIQSCGQNSKSKISTIVEVDEKGEKAIQTLREFYTMYISACDNSVENGEENLTLLRNKYLTKALLNKLEDPDLELDADPLLNAQDCDKNCIKTLEIKPETGRKNVYSVCYVWPSDNKNICIKLLLINENGNFLIDDILDNENIYGSE
ncbi:hypothetical protein AGMMS50239_25530 [Bacteroidia bacterium]|nr:hypothetical protein AGMMS50239_25530 [Bacteroidia bacterium]